MGSKLRGWLRWLIALLGHIAELHPGTVTFGAGTPPTELPRRPAPPLPPDHTQRPGAGGAVLRDAAPPAAAPAPQMRSETI